MKAKLKDQPQPSKSITLAPPPIDNKALELTSAGLLKTLLDTRIVDDRSYAVVAGLFLKAKTFIKNIQSEFQNAKHQADLAHKSICALEKKALARFLEIEETAEQKMALYGEENELPKIDGVVPSEAYTYEIVDPTLIPREFCVPDRAKIRAMVSATKEEAEKLIPGIKVFHSTRFAGKAAAAE